MFSPTTKSPKRSPPTTPSDHHHHRRGELPLLRSDNSVRTAGSSSNASSNASRTGSSSMNTPNNRGNSNIMTLTNRRRAFLPCTGIQSCFFLTIVWATIMFLCQMANLGDDGGGVYIHRMLNNNNNNSTDLMPHFGFGGPPPAAIMQKSEQQQASSSIQGKIENNNGAAAPDRRPPHHVPTIKAASTTPRVIRPLTPKQRQRQERTRPSPIKPLPQQQQTKFPNGTSTTTITPWLQHQQQQPKTVQVAWNKQRDWKELCQKAGLNDKSRVVITSILSQPAASATALLLHEQCGVTKMAGTDALFPNMRLSRMRLMQVYHKLLQRIPKLLFIHTPNGGLCSRREATNARTGVDILVSEDDWLHSFAPTHVLLMETTPLFTKKVEWIMSPSSYLLHAMKKSRELWSDFIHFLLESSSSSPTSKHSKRGRHDDNKKKKDVPPRVVHVTSPTVPNASPVQSPMLAVARQVLASTWISMLAANNDNMGGLVTVELPPLFGPWVTNLDSDLWKDDKTLAEIDFNYNLPVHEIDARTPHLFVDDAMLAVMTALQVQQQQSSGAGGLHHQVHIPADRTMPLDVLKKSLQKHEVKDMDKRIKQTLSYKYSLEYPYGVPNTATTRRPWWGEPTTKYGETLGLRPTRLPCASQCMQPDSSSSFQQCTPSVFDNAVVEASHNASAGCVYVLYIGEFADNVTDLFETKMPDPERLCRVAFVSAHAPIVKKTLGSSRSATAWNGKLMANNWKLVWVDIEGGADSMNDGDFGLLKIDPSRLFAPTVHKAMHVSTRAFAAAPDSNVVTVMATVDLQAPQSVNDRLFRETRRGTELSRWMTEEAWQSRHVVLFGGAPPKSDKPKGVDEYLIRTLAKLLEQNQTMTEDKLMPAHQRTFYTKAAHLVQVGEERPQFEIERTLYKPFPFEWTTDFFFVHDMSMEEARVLRCRWLDEYLAWGSNRHVMDISLAYLLAELRISRQLGWTKSLHEMKMNKNMFWSPFLVPPVFDEAEDAEIQPSLNGDGQVFLRLLQPKSDDEDDE